MNRRTCAAVTVFVIVIWSSSWKLCLALQEQDGGGGNSEGFFNGSANAVLKNTLDIRRVTSLSFRTCAHGGLFHQSGAKGDSLTLTVDPSGDLRLLWRLQGGPEKMVKAGTDLADNRWHAVYVRYFLGSVLLEVDNETTVAANSTYNTDMLQLNLRSPNPEMIVGQGFIGCILQGASVVLDDPTVTSFGVNWTMCPLRGRGQCDQGSAQHDFCYNQPCHKHGECVSLHDGYNCKCTTRYAGKNCEQDTGPLCDRQPQMCRNGGVCQEDKAGNQTTCVCAPNFFGPFCESELDSGPCDNNPCRNNGSCRINHYGDDYECLCPPGFAGLDCEIDINECSSAPCEHGGFCVDGINTYTCNCESTGYRGERCEENVNECSDSNPCSEGSQCFDTYGGFFCECPPGFGGKTCDQELDECVSGPCRNGATCRNLLDHYECDCPLGFQGVNCEQNFDDCSNVTCPRNSECIDGVNSYNCLCQPGFSGTPPHCIEVDECMSNPCRNGGVCRDRNATFVCECPMGHSGVLCENQVNECSSDPCQNGGTCMDELGHFSCSCPQGFEGLTCENDLDECAEEPCINALKCLDKIADYECQCIPGWGGKNCDQDINECASGPCHNNATCHDHLGNFSCACEPGFTGNFCEVDTDECATKPCTNGGTCIDQVNNYKCACTPNFMGTSCEFPYNDCVVRPCLNGATCSTEPPAKRSQCSCAPGFTGDRCQIDIDDCAAIVCTAGMLCFDLVGSYECRCPDGFTGDECSENINECETNLCKEGSCVDGIANYTCACKPGFTGRHCDTDINECDEVPCVNGICRNVRGGYECYCTPGYAGNRCELEYDECLSHPCHHNATCINHVNSYECVCQPGFTGRECHIDVDECASSPCVNGGNCTDVVNGYVCSCVEGYTGKECQTNIDECASGPCLNEAKCEDLVNGYTCDCSDTGFHGMHCEINIDDCLSQPCVHDGNCTDLVKAFSCTCHHGYTGVLCEVDIAECSSLPCLNGAECLERSNHSLYQANYKGLFEPDSFSFDTAGGYFCECLPGFTGVNCEVDIDDCVSSPCHNGATCVDMVNAFRCECAPGFEGDHCESEIDECQLYEPCSANSVCQDLVADYFCKCPKGIGGKNCTVELIGCRDHNCTNGATCVPYVVGETKHRFNCTCMPGFAGQWCQASTTASFNGGSDAYYDIKSAIRNGYKLSARFRTTLPDGLLVVANDHMLLKVSLMQGAISVSLHDNDGDDHNVYELLVGSGLNSGAWQSLTLVATTEKQALPTGATGMVLVQVSNDTVVRKGNMTLSIRDFEGAFRTTHVGGTSPSNGLGRASNDVTILPAETRARARNFIGCMQDIEVNGVMVLPERMSRNQSAVSRGCPREEQCVPMPCQNGGQCTDLWTSFNCHCPRQYYGSLCQNGFVEATFGHESNISMAEAVIPEEDRPTLAKSATVDFLLRTRQATGLVFYLGSGDSLESISPVDTFVATVLDDGHLRVIFKLSNASERVSVSKPRLDDGYYHLIQITLNQTALMVMVNETISLQMVVEAATMPLNAQKLFLGNLPGQEQVATTAAARRVTRAVDVAIEPGLMTIATTALTTTKAPVVARRASQHLKGVLWDVRVNRRPIQLFAPNVVNEELLPPVDNVKMSNVLKGVVSDNTCKVNPCQNDGNCSVTWNDFSCSCTIGFKGKICSELEYCSYNKCPAGSECRSLDDGYECISSGTFNGVNSSTEYTLSLQNGTDLQENSISFHLRSVLRGTILAFQDPKKPSSAVHVEFSDGELRLTDGTEEEILGIGLNDGTWHSMNLVFDSNIVHLTVDGESSSLKVNTTYWETIKGLMKAGVVSVGAGGFKGCLKEVRVGKLLLPFFEGSELANDTSSRRFSAQHVKDVSVGCVTCYEHECQNGAFCVDPTESFVCNCSAGYMGPQCQIDIDECTLGTGNLCKNGATCLDRVNDYECSCVHGWSGKYCQVNVDECLGRPCRNGGVCIDDIGFYTCNCTANYTGVDCEKEKTASCATQPCLHGATCRNVTIPETREVVNYTCHCTGGYKGTNCEEAINFCETQPCLHNGTCLSDPTNARHHCTCIAGFVGPNCETNFDDCSSSPCRNMAICHDGVDGFSCACTRGFTGPFCETDINECEVNPCANRATCRNNIGSFECLCETGFCGPTCGLEDPCNDVNCTEVGQICVSSCNETASYSCVCDVSGEESCESSGNVENAGIDSTVLAIIVGSVVAAVLAILVVALVTFLMMARKKRATRGTYSPSRQEMFGSRVEMGNMMKPPPEERLI